MYFQKKWQQGAFLSGDKLISDTVIYRYKSQKYNLKKAKYISEKLMKVH